jgi:hypothetical protein
MLPADAQALLPFHTLDSRSESAPASFFALNRVKRAVYVGRHVRFSTISRCASVGPRQCCEDVLPLAERKGNALIDEFPVVIGSEKPADTTF